MEDCIKTTCDICGTTVDGDPSKLELIEMKNYAVIDIRLTQRNPKKRRKFYDEGSLVVCADCMDKCMKQLTLNMIMKKIAESVAD